MDERHAWSGGRDPQDRGRERLGDRETYGAANSSAQHGGWRRPPEPDLEEHDERRQRQTESDVQGQTAVERPERRGRVRQGRTKKDAGENQPGHGMTPRVS